MEAVSNDDMMTSAREYFRENKYSLAEPILNQLILKNAKSPEVFHMLGTIYYDQGKFNKAIRAFRRALELEPTYTDASVGLSIILNDIGKYEEGRKVFDEARELLARQNSNEDPYINEKFSIKHDELGEMYFHHSRFKEALEQYYKALSLSNRKPELTMKIVECYLRLQETEKALRELRNLVKEYTGFLSARVRLGKILYDTGDIAGAIEQWEATTHRDPGHAEAQRLLRQAQAVTQQRGLAEL
ncbi:MAG: tetratricopeptide repeat protein [Bdellovibrionales bacterium]|nr:tetratricopeptide repeat protein [Bdellovibrionales bacterium]